MRNCATCDAGIPAEEPTGSCHSCHRFICEACSGDFCAACTPGLVAVKRCEAQILPLTGERHQCERPAFTISQGMPLCEVCAGRVTLPLRCAACEVVTGTRSLYATVTCGPEYCIRCRWKHRGEKASEVTEDRELASVK